MKRLLFIAIYVALITITGFLFTGKIYSEDLCIPLGIITISPPDGVEAKKSPVDFPHAVHFDYNCKECHHKWTGDDKNINCTISGCHDSNKSLLQTDKKESYRYFKTAYHIQCIICHKEIAQANKELEMSKKEIKGTLPKTGPTGCNSCHPKQK